MSHIIPYVCASSILLFCGCSFLNDAGEYASKSGSVVKNAITDMSEKCIYLIVPDGMRVEGVSYDIVDTVGCNDLLVRVNTYEHFTSPSQALEKIFYFDDRANGYYNSLAGSHISVDHIDGAPGGVTNVFLNGSLQVNGVCDVPRIQAQLKSTVQQFDKNAHVRIFVNNIPLEDVLSENDMIF